MISKQTEIFNKITDERIKDEKVDSNNLIYRQKGNTAAEKFHEFDNPFNLLDKIREGKIKLADAKDDQTKSKSNLDGIKK